MFLVLKWTQAWRYFSFNLAIHDLLSMWKRSRRRKPWHNDSPTSNPRLRYEYLNPCSIWPLTIRNRSRNPGNNGSIRCWHCSVDTQLWPRIRGRKHVTNLKSCFQLAKENLKFSRSLGFAFKVENVNHLCFGDGTEIIDYKFENVFGEATAIHNFQFNQSIKQIRA